MAQSYAEQMEWEEERDRQRKDELVLLEHRLQADLHDAERKAWDSLARYKFQMFGYWAGIWVHLNRVGRFERPNPWKDLVHAARRAKGETDGTEAGDS